MYESRNERWPRLARRSWALSVALVIASLCVGGVANAENDVSYAVEHTLTQLDVHTVRIDSFMTFQIEGVREELGISGDVDVQLEYGLTHRGKLADRSVAMLPRTDSTEQVGSITLTFDDYGFYSGVAELTFLADGAQKTVGGFMFFIVHTPEQTRLVSFGQFRKMRKMSLRKAAARD